MSLDFKGLNSYALRHVTRLLPELLPGGEFRGNEYECADLSGGVGRSMKVNVVTGAWCDFGDPSRPAGGDLVSLCAANMGVEQMDAYKWLAGHLGYTNGAGSNVSPAPKVEDELVPPPEDVELPNFKGMHWAYRDFDGRLLFFVERFEADGKKQFCPHSWSKSGKWVKKAWKNNRPIYGLEILATRPDAPVCICEGEKSVDAARKLATGYVVIGWSGGVNAWNKTDWSPIYNRKKVLLWPDADDVGRKAMHDLASQLYGLAGEIKIIDTDGLNEGWDAADAIADNWDAAMWVRWAKPIAKEFHLEHVETTAVVKPTDVVVEEPKLKKADVNAPDFDAIMALIPDMQVRYVTTDDGKRKIKPYSQAEVADHIIAHIKDHVMKFDDSFFSYNGTHWVEWAAADFDKLFCAIVDLFDLQTGASRVEGIVKIVKKMIKAFNRSPFTLNPYLVNFMDGTLEINRGDDGKFFKKFRAHSKDDMCLSTLPMKYEGDRSVQNHKFDDMILRVTGSDLSKIHMLKQMYGAMLAPIFPHFWFLEGDGGTGKSSVILGASYLRAKDADGLKTGGLSMVSPSEFGERFSKEAMLGSLVNFVLDIPIHTPIDDAVVKQVEDRVPMLVDRKNRKAVFVPIPAVHIYGCNKVPPTLEWGSNAMARRVTIIKFDKLKTDSQNYTRDFARLAFEHCPEGVLNFALEGLDDLLINNGIYYSSEESQERVADWQIEKSPVALFFRELTRDKEVEISTHGFYSLVYVENAHTDNCIKRSRLWDWFVTWHKESFSRPPALGKQSFFKIMAQNGLTVVFDSSGCRVVKNAVEKKFGTADFTVKLHSLY